MIVLDASVAVKLVFPEQDSDRALALLNATIQAGDTVLAPPLLPFEVANAIRQRMIRQGLALPRADQIMTRFLAFPIMLTAPDGLYNRAIALADAHNLPAAYDAHYLALAQSHSCDLWTDDQRLLRTVGSALSYARAISTYPLP
jgi:predicted nucleic acid-binding protein